MAANLYSGHLQYHPDWPHVLALDGREYTLTPEMCVIADDNGVPAGWEVKWNKDYRVTIRDVEVRRLEEPPPPKEDEEPVPSVPSSPEAAPPEDVIAHAARLLAQAQRSPAAVAGRQPGLRRGAIQVSPPIERLAQP